MSKTYEIALIGILSAICVVSRLTLQFLPNIKPVTSIIIIVSIFMGAKYGISIAVIQTLISGMILGLGTYIPFQILAWALIAVIASILSPISKNIYIVSIISTISGYLFGIIVSLERLIYTNLEGTIVYYISGLYFDTLHAIGNLAFCLVIYTPLTKVIKRFK